MRLLADSKRFIPQLISSVAGGLVLATMAWPNLVGDSIFGIAQIVTAVAVLLGLGNLAVVHLRSLRHRSRGWPYSLTLVAVALAVFLLELVPETVGGVTAAQMRGFSAEVFRYMYQPLALSVLALLTAFALRASWRALQARPGEALLLLLVAIVFLVASGPWAAALPGLRESLEWVRAYPVLGVARGLLLGISLGALVAATRLLLGFDQPYLDR